MKQYPLAVIITIKPDQKDTLLQVLQAIRTDIKGNAYLRFPEVGRTHFARFVLLGGGTRATRDQASRLLFSSNHDGPVDEYLDLLVDKAGPGIEAIFQTCEGYPGLPLSDPAYKTKFKEFIKAHSYKTQTFYQGYRGQSVAEVQAAIDLRARLEDLLNQDTLDAFKAEIKRIQANLTLQQRVRLWIDGIREAINDALAGFLRRAFIQNQEGLASSSPAEAAKSKTTLHRIRLGLKFLLGVRIFDKEMPRPTTPSVEVDTRANITDWLDTVQNEMTVVSEIDPKQLNALKHFLFVLNGAGKYVFNRGDLGGIATIHFGRWAIIDDGKNLLFESNYDGNWEQYIGDFVDKATVGMDSIWGNSAASVNYPMYGAQDLQTFKKVIIDHQVQAKVFYSAYKHDSVKNIVKDLTISKLATAAKTPAEIERLLTYL